MDTKEPSKIQLQKELANVKATLSALQAKSSEDLLSPSVVNPASFVQTVGRLSKREEYHTWATRATIELTARQLWSTATRAPKPPAFSLLCAAISDSLVDDAQKQGIAQASELWSFLRDKFILRTLGAQASALQSLMQFTFENSVSASKSRLLDLRRDLVGALNKTEITIDYLVLIIALVRVPLTYQAEKASLKQKKTTLITDADSAFEELFSSLLEAEGSHAAANYTKSRFPAGPMDTTKPARKDRSRPVCEKCKSLGFQLFLHTSDSGFCKGQQAAFQRGIQQASQAHQAMSFNVDSGTTDTIVNKSNNFYSSVPISHPIRTANNTFMYASEVGEIKSSELKLKNVLYCAEATDNLLSVSQLAAQGLDTLFTHGQVIIGRGGSMATTIQTGSQIGSTYRINLNPVTESSSLATANETHLRMNHLNHDRIQQLHRCGALPDLVPDSHPQHCHSCSISKQRKGTPPASTNSRATRPAQLIHTDLLQINPAASSGAQYVLTFTCDFSRFVFVYLLANKSAVFEAFRNLDARIYNLFARHISTFRSDNGGEFANTDFTTYCSAYGIKQEFTVPYSPNQNGVSERLNLTLANSVRAMLTESGLSSGLWDEALKNAVHTKNLTTTSKTGDKTPYELFHGVQPQSSHLQVFGHLCYVVTTPYDRRTAASFKLAARSQLCHFLGYASDSKAYRLLTSTGTIVKAKYEDVIFPKTPIVFPSDSSQSIGVDAGYREPVLDDSLLPQQSIRVDDRTGLANSEETLPTNGSGRILGRQVSDRPELSGADPCADGNVTSDAQDTTPDAVQDLSEPDPVSSSPTSSSSLVPVLLPAQHSLPQEDIDAIISAHPTYKPTGVAGVYKHPMKGNVTLEPVTEFAPKDIKLGPTNEKRVRFRVDYSESHLALSSATAIQAAVLTPEDVISLTGVSWERLPSEALSTSAVPLTYEDIELQADSDAWYKAADSEIAMLMEKGTWELVPLPPGRKAIKNKWVFRIKRNPDGTVIKYKARLCACGYSQIQGLDFQEIYAPVCRSESLRLFLAIAAGRDMEIHQMDVTGAFLNGSLKEEIYMRQPPGFVDPTHPGHVCQLHRNLYGLKQAPRVWHQTLVPELNSLGFLAIDADPCIFQRRTKRGLSLISLYVDDLAIAADSKVELNEIKKALSSKFKMTDEEEISFILGIQVRRDRGKRAIYLSNAQYVQKILEDFNMTAATPVHTPMECKTISSADSPEPGSAEWLRMQNVPYRESVGQLTYLMRTARPDLAFAVSLVNRYLHNPGERHWAAVKRILRYVKGTLNYELCLSPQDMTLTGTTCDRTSPVNGPLKLSGNVDADWAGSDEAKSTTGYVFYLGSALISWSSKAQPTTATSSTHAEYMAAYSAAAECIWLRSFLSSLDLLSPGCPTTIYCDNQAAIALSKDHMVNPRSKHFESKFHYVREQVRTGAVALQHCPGIENVADLLTKPLRITPFVKHRQALGLRLTLVPSVSNLRVRVS